LIPAFDPSTGALPPDDHPATLAQIADRFGSTPRRRWLMEGLRAAIEASPDMGFPEFFRQDRGGPAARCDSSGEGSGMIKSDAQRDRTLAQIDGFRRALSNLPLAKADKRSKAVRGSYEGKIRQLEDGLREYDELKSGMLALPRVERLDQIAPFITRIRIAKGVSQTELARRLGVSKQVVSRYEDSDYQTVAIARLQEILDAIGVKTRITLSA
jgi:DNA-binding Xre family transcriptional regulator